MQTPHSTRLKRAWKVLLAQKEHFNSLSEVEVEEEGNPESEYGVSGTIMPWWLLGGAVLGVPCDHIGHTHKSHDR